MKTLDRARPVLRDTLTRQQWTGFDLLAPACALVVWGALTVADYFALIRLPVRALSTLLILGVPVLALAAFLIVHTPRLRLMLGRFAGGSWIITGALLAATYVKSPTVVAGLGVLAVATALVRRWPAAAIGVLIAVSGTYGTLLLYDVHPGGITLLVVGALSVALLLHYLGEPRRPRFVFVPGMVLVGAYLALTVVDVAVRYPNAAAVRAFRLSAAYMVTLVVIAYGPWSLESIRRSAQIVVVVGILVGAYATLRWQTGPTAREQVFVRQASVYGLSVAGPGGAKTFGSFPNGPALGGWTAMVLPFCVALVLFGPRRMRVLALGLPLMVIGMLASGSRASLVGTIAGTGVVVLLALFARGNVKGRVSKVLVFGVAGLIVGAALYTTVLGDNPAKLARYSNILNPSRDESFNNRPLKWRAALADWPTHLFGHGLGTASPGNRIGRFPPPNANNVDNSYVQIAYEQGMPVMALFVLALLALLAGLMRRATEASRDDRFVYAIGAAGTLTAFLIVCLSQQFQYDLVSIGTWVPLGLGISPFMKMRTTQVAG